MGCPNTTPPHIFDRMTPPTATNAAQTSVVTQLIAVLSRTRDEQGGWSVIAGRPADAESTAWMLLGASRLANALPEFAASLPTARDQSHRWLLQQQTAAGSWEYRRGPTAATWPTAPALLALRAHASGAGSTEAIERAHTWLVDEHSLTPGWWPRLLARFADAPTEEPAVVLDGTLDGFGWAHQTFAWVEPTALAMMAMCAAPSARAWRERVEIGVNMLLDRQSPDGGWNYGNKRVLGVDLPGYPDTTGWALLGLAAAERAGVVSASRVRQPMQRAFAALSIPESSFVSPLPVALELLASRALRATAAQPHIASTDPAQTALRLKLASALEVALHGLNDGYPMLETRTAILSLFALHDVDLLDTVSSRTVS